MCRVMQRMLARFVGTTEALPFASTTTRADRNTLENYRLRNDSRQTAHSQQGQAGPGPCMVVEAHARARTAAEHLKAGELKAAVQAHLTASQLFLDAAEQLQDLSQTTGSALMLLSDGHGREAQKLQLMIRRGEYPGDIAGQGQKRPSNEEQQQKQREGRRPPLPLRTHTGANAGEGGAPAVPWGGGMGAIDGTSSLYQSAVAPERGWTQQVEDMLALEKALLSIGAQPTFTSGTLQAASANPSARYMSSTLGDSFFLVSNRQSATREGFSAMWENSMLASSSSSVKHALADGGVKQHAARAREGLRGPRPLSSSVTVAAMTAGRDDGMKGRDSRPAASSQITVGASSGGFLNGVEAVHQGEVMRLLLCMKTLGDENTLLLKQVEEGAKVKQENLKLKKEMLSMQAEVEEFKATYATKLNAMKAALEEFRQKYPHELNPANVVGSSADKARIDALEGELHQLHGRLNREKEASRKKDHVIRRYEQWYKTLKSRVGESQARAGQAATAIATNLGGGRPPSRPPTDLRVGGDVHKLSSWPQHNAHGSDQANQPRATQSPIS